MTGITGLPSAKLAAHEAAVARLREEYAALPPGAPVRLAKRTSNLFRFPEGAPGREGAPGLKGTPGRGSTPHRGSARGRGSAAGPRTLDVSAFSRVLHIDPRAKIAVVGGMTTYEDLCEATLPHGLMPLVVPQLKTITLGGAVTGLGIESTSLRNGMPHESVTEMEILTGDGRVVTATQDNEHHELFHGFPNSYGTLGYALALTIELEPVRPFVHLRHFRFSNPRDCMTAIGEIAEAGSCDGHRADFTDGTAFSNTELYLTVGAFSDRAPWRSDYTGDKIYYQSVRQVREDFLSISDYLWRWDTDWFWCSRPFGVQKPLIRRLWPRRYRRSDVYRRLVAFDRRYGLTDTLNAHRQRPQREAVIQDVEIPVARGADFLEFFARETGMSPVWLCPLRLRGERSWPLYPLQPGEVYVNFGFWGTVPLPPGRRDGYHNRMIEDEVSALGGHKSLYSTSYYSEQEFRRRYNGAAYEKLKAEYDGQGRLLGLYDKCVRGR
ncbi:MAG: FAD-binding oxidoreductase [Streptosporangiaceae bacterium]|nr:FAD-binding oxidoreductase [Streptosporangiaceae bacterium]MBV9858448.1 FAD-binding oxidoreductase [Streptosporangiaceae bacterium]